MEGISKSTVAKCGCAIVGVAGTSAATASMTNGSKAPGETLPSLSNTQIPELPKLNEEWIQPTPKPAPQPQPTPPPPPPPSGSTDPNGNSQENQPQSSDNQMESQPDNQQKQEPPPESPPKEPEPDASQQPPQNPDTSEFQSGDLNGSLDPCQVFVQEALSLILKDFSDKPKLTDMNATQINIEGIQKSLKALESHSSNPSQSVCKNVSQP